MSTRKADPDMHREMIHTAIHYLENKGYEQIRADLDDYEKPARLTRQGTDEGYVPDITARKNGGKFYFDVVTANKDEHLHTVGKWRLLSTLAEHRNGKLMLFVPYGKMNFTNRILQDNNIEAEVMKIQDLPVSVSAQ